MGLWGCWRDRKCRPPHHEQKTPSLHWISQNSYSNLLKQAYQRQHLEVPSVESCLVHLVTHQQFRQQSTRPIRIIPLENPPPPLAPPRPPLPNPRLDPRGPPLYDMLCYRWLWGTNCTLRLRKVTRRSRFPHRNEAYLSLIKKLVSIFTESTLSSVLGRCLVALKLPTPNSLPTPFHGESPFCYQGCHLGKRPRHKYSNHTKGAEG